MAFKKMILATLATVMLAFTMARPALADDDGHLGLAIGLWGPNVEFSLQNQWGDRAWRGEDNWRDGEGEYNGWGDEGRWRRDDEYRQQECGWRVEERHYRVCHNHEDDGNIVRRCYWEEREVHVPTC